MNRSNTLVQLRNRDTFVAVGRTNDYLTVLPACATDRSCSLSMSSSSTRISIRKPGAMVIGRCACRKNHSYAVSSSRSVIGSRRLSAQRPTFSHTCSGHPMLIVKALQASRSVGQPLHVILMTQKIWRFFGVLKARSVVERAVEERQWSPPRRCSGSKVSSRGRLSTHATLNIH
jgi:hypothetical protein